MKTALDYQRIFERVNWDFADFSSRIFKLDINNVHWYPASFIPPIPDIMVQTISKKGDLVLDPFAGSGVTLVEAAKLGRNFVGVDINPFAIDIAKAKFQAIVYADSDWKNDLRQEVSTSRIGEPISNYCERNEIIPEVFKWFQKKTLTELVNIHNVVLSNSRNQFLMEKMLFSSILNRSCSQRRHYTYITDGCYPREFKHKPAKELFLKQVEQTSQSADIFREQYRRRHSEEFIYDGKIELADARNLEWINDGSIDLIVTSPPYLGTHDYLKSMRLTNLFFPEPNYKQFLENEIGARYKRQRKTAYEEYVNDMEQSFEECYRVLKTGGFFGMILGMGKGRVVKSDIVRLFLDFLTGSLNFTIIYRNTRKISSRRIRFPGVLVEHIIVLQKTK